MFARKTFLFAAAVAAATPVVGRAATITLSYDAADFMVSTDGGVTFNPVTIGGTASAPSVTVPVGSILEIGVAGAVTNNPNPASGGAYDAAHAIKQPGTLGFGSFGVGFTDSSAATASMDPSNVAIDNPPFASVSSTGTADGAGGVSFPTIAGGQNTNSDSVTTATGVAAIGYGGGTAAELFNSLYIDASKAGSAVFTSVTPTGAITYNTYTSGGTTATAKPVYNQITAVAGTDGINNLANLTVIVGNTTPTATPLISLTTAPTGFGSQVGTLNLTGKGNGSYNVATATFTATTTGYVAVTGFNPGTDKEVYGLAVTGSAADLATLVTDINATGGNVDSNGTVVASLRTAASNASFAFLPAADDIILTTSGTTSGSPFSFSFHTLVRNKVAVETARRPVARNTAGTASLPER